jgi:hypothetical protein
MKSQTNNDYLHTESVPPPGIAVARTVSASTWKAFAIWTAVFWGATAVLGVLFFLGVLDFATSSKTSLYGISVWLNGCLIPLLMPQAKLRPKLDVLHECLVIWVVSYTMTNLLWEIPWVLCSPFIFENLHTLDDIVARTEWVRGSILNMYWWVLAAFGSVDLRTVNHNSTFYALEFFAFFNVACAFYFFRLNKRGSALRYLIPVMAGGEAVAATFIFSFSEVFAGFVNMSGGLADTLLALVWTQYQYVLYPAVFGYIGYKLLLADLHFTWVTAKDTTHGLSTRS